MPAWPRVWVWRLPTPRSVRSCRRPQARIWYRNKHRDKEFRAQHHVLRPYFFVSSHFVERGQQILDQIIGVLKAGREPHQSVANAELGTLLRRQPLMRGRGRMRDQALGVAEIIGDANQRQ